jgi:hypothetical protein
MAAKVQKGDPWFRIQAADWDIGKVEQHHTWFDARESAQCRFGMDVQVSILEPELAKELEAKIQEDERRLSVRGNTSSKVSRARKPSRK